MPHNGADLEVPGFLALACSRGVVVSALKVAVVVGSLLALINHGDDLFTSGLTTGSVLQIVLTYMVPYGVATYSSVRALQRRAAEVRESRNRQGMTG